MNKKILELENVHLSYKTKLGVLGKDNWVLKGISFELFHGEALGIIGDNGAGKSTLLKLMADIISPTKGSVWREKNTRTQLLSLNLGFNTQLDAIDNIVLSLVTQGHSISRAKSEIDKIIEYAEIEHIASHPIRTYSSGERARLGFAIALQASPDVILLDEVLSVGDERFKKKSSASISQLIKSDQTVVLVSHSGKTLQKFCERTVWIENGKTKEIGKTDNVLENYQNAKLN